MTHSVIGNRFRSVKTRSRLPYAINLMLLPWLVACAGDLDSKFGQGGSTGNATGGASATGGSSSGGGSGTGGSGAGGAAAGCDAVAMVFVPKCSSVGCHLGVGSLGGPLDLTSDAKASMAVGAPQATTCMGDTQAKIVNPSAPFSGTMMRVISGESCGSATMMPLGATPAVGGLTQAEINCIASYYTAKLK